MILPRGSSRDTTIAAFTQPWDIAPPTRWTRTPEPEQGGLNHKKTPGNPDLMVGVAGFEPTISCSQSRRATKLRYTP